MNTASQALTTLGAVTEEKIAQNGPPPKGEFVYVDIGSIDIERKRIVEPSTLPVEKAPSRAKQVLKAGDVLVSMTRPNRNAVAIVPNELDGAIGSTGFHVLRRRDVEPSWIFYAVQTNDFVDTMCGLVQGALYPAVRPKDIRNYSVSIPSPAEQRRLVAEIEKQFTRLDAGIAALRRTQANLKRYRAAVLKAACEGRLVPTEAELAKQTGGRFESGDELMAKIGNLAGADAKPRRAGRMWGAGHVPDLTDQERLTMPKGWAWIKVRDVGFDPESAVQVGPMSMKSEDFTDNGVPVLNVGCVQWDRFVESKLDHLPATKASDFDRYRIRPGDVLFTRSGTVGRCAVAQSHQDGWLMTFHLLRARPNPKKCVPEFLRMVFEGAPHIRRQTKAASVGTTRAGFNTNLLASLDVPLPPLAEQTRIVAEVERRLSVVEELETAVNINLQRATRLRQSILQRAFSGNSSGNVSCRMQ
jgi:type I restriction enzyme S subunit